MDMDYSEQLATGRTNLHGVGNWSIISSFTRHQPEMRLFQGMITLRCCRGHCTLLRTNWNYIILQPNHTQIYMFSLRYFIMLSNNNGVWTNRKTLAFEVFIANFSVASIQHFLDGLGLQSQLADAHFVTVPGVQMGIRWGMGQVHMNIAGIYGCSCP